MSGSITRIHTYADGVDEIVGQDHIDDYDQIINAVNTHFSAATIDHPAGSVGATALASSAVETAKIKDDNVTSAKIADGQVAREHLVIGRAFSFTGGGTEAAQGGAAGVYTVSTQATDADGSVIIDSTNLTAADNTYKDMIMVVLTSAAVAASVGRRYVISSSDQSDRSITLKAAADGGGNVGDVAGGEGVVLAVGDTFKIVKSPVCAVHIGDNEIRTEHILNGEITPAKCADGVAGWLGSRTRIKLLPGDFVTVNVAAPEAVDDYGAYVGAGAASVVCTVEIPIGFKATAVMVYGSDATNDVIVYECSIENSSTHTSKGTGKVDSEINIDDVTATSTNYLGIKVARGSTDEVHGGYVTITEA